MDRRVWQEARALRGAGYRVSVICPKMGAYQASRETIEGIEIWRHWVPEASGPAGYLIEYAWALAAEFVLALRVYRRTRFRTLQACNPPDTIFLVALFFKCFGVRFVFDHHDLNPELYQAKYGKRRGLFYRLVCLAEKLTYRAADVSIATNESYRQIAIERGGMAPDRVFVVRSSPDPSVFFRGAPRPELKRGKAYLVVYLGVMGPQEGLDLLLDAIGLIAQESPGGETAFTLIGGGPEFRRLRAIAAQKGLEAIVQFPGRVSDADLAVYLSTADVCVAPDPKNEMNDKSTMNKVLEYMAFGCPVVLFDLTEGRRAAGDAALYARPNDLRDFADQIVSLLNSPALRRQLGGEGRRRIEDELNWNRQAAEFLRAYGIVSSPSNSAAGTS